MKIQSYWKICIEEAFEEAGITATTEQIEMVAQCVEGGHENYGLATGQDCITNPVSLENERLAKELAIERRKVVCPECLGERFLVTHGPCHTATSQCWKCRGEGKVLP